ncbi:MAG: AAA family ATPase, partial [Bacteroidales bacterium]
MIYINKITNRRPIEERTEYPYNIPAIRSLDEFEFNSNVTFIIGENGSGKSTFVEAI